MKEIDLGRHRTRQATHDPHLTATIITRRPLLYRARPSHTIDRPPHVRAGSSLTWLGTHLVLVQDDANFVAVVDTVIARARAITLPALEEGARLFDDARGNKKFKLDLEACCTLQSPAGPLFLALGSGSKKRRRRVITIESLESKRPRVKLIDAGSLYLALEEVAEFAGSDMNIEGALRVDGALRLFSRGNGAAKSGRTPVNASGELDADALLAYLANPNTAPVPRLSNVVQYALGDLDGLPLGFTDAALVGEQQLYTAAAEASEDASQDGAVTGSVIGVIPSRGDLRYALLTDESGARTTDKVEGIVALPSRSDRVYIVVDPDDHSRPSELCEVSLSGAWR